MKRKIPFVILLVVLAVIFTIVFFILSAAFFGPEKESKISSPFDLRLANGTLSEKDVEKFRLALAAVLDNEIEENDYGKLTNEKLMEFQIRVQKIEVAKKEYLVVYLIKEGGRKKQLIWGDSVDRLKKPGNIKKCAQEAAEAVIYEASGFEKQLETEKSKKILVLQGARQSRLFFYR